MMRFLVILIASTSVLFACNKVNRNFGCTNERAINYDPTARYDNGTCIGVKGCMKEGATNYDSAAVEPDGSCKWEGKPQILVQKYTGFACPNCPFTADALHEYWLEWGDAINIVTVHATSFANPGTSGLPDYRTEWGGLLAEEKLIGALPMINVNHILLGDEFSYSVTNFEDLLLKEFSSDMQVGIDLNADWDQSEVNLNYSIASLNSTSGNIRVGAFLLENSLISPQAVGGEKVYDYVHEHVLRKRVISNSLSLGSDNLEGNFSIPLEDSWLAENCEVVVYVYRDHSEIKEQRILGSKKIKLKIE